MASTGCHPTGTCFALRCQGPVFVAGLGLLHQLFEQELELFAFDAPFTEDPADELPRNLKVVTQIVYPQLVARTLARSGYKFNDHSTNFQVNNNN